MSFGVKLPIERSSINGFVELKTFSATIKQNFKMLLLTVPGERVMIPEYGVGMKQFLFSDYGSAVEGEIRSKINKQVGLYLPIISLKEILIDRSGEDYNLLSIKIYYSIPDLGVQDLLEFTI